MTTRSVIVFSVVSHGQLNLIKDFLHDFRRQSLDNVKLVLTLNIPEDESVLRDFVDLPISIIRNITPKGFGANHNAAFNSYASCDVFVIVNPDIRLKSFSLNSLTQLFDVANVGACAPIVLSSSGSLEDSARRFPTFASLVKRLFTGRGGPDYAASDVPVKVDWTAGMFVAYRPQAFAEVGGFDERYFMYYEDADICRRLAARGWITLLQPATSVIHDAQRASHRSWRHMRWHGASIFRFLFFPMARS
jgi:GT2 family glycosyltransferase